MNPAAIRPRPARILLVEDDATNRAFLSAALAGLPARVVDAPGAAEALALVARGAAFDLWFIDARLPDADGGALLAALRLFAPATPALAHTAAHDPGCAAGLRAAGFDGVLRKPVAIARLRATVRDALAAGAGSAVAESPAAWPAAWPGARLSTLRGMFHAELPAQRRSIEQALAAGDIAAATDVLHRLRASCGFVGASALGASVRALQADPASLAALRRFGACVDAVLALAGGAIG